MCLTYLGCMVQWIKLVSICVKLETCLHHVNSWSLMYSWFLLNGCYKTSLPKCTNDENPIDAIYLYISWNMSFFFKRIKINDWNQCLCAFSFLCIKLMNEKLQVQWIRPHPHLLRWWLRIINRHLYLWSSIF